MQQDTAVGRDQPGA